LAALCNLEAMLPKGNQLKAGRVLAGLEQREVAAKAKINVTTLYRMEECGVRPVRGHAHNVEAVVNVLRKAGIEITESGVQLIKSPRR